MSTQTGWAYVAFVFDVHSRAIVGWTAASAKTTAGVQGAEHGAVAAGSPRAPGRARIDPPQRCRVSTRR
ncbi:hypothetical protein [Amycolatopsis bartoniae]|uniref:hypothetical protein n=1 Tax=Amycolatopsis bartoniae TaxID=941986 RepID=UPI0035711871